MNMNKKKIAAAALAAVLVAALAVPSAAAERRDEFQIIKKAVRENPDYRPGTDVRFLKVLVADTRTGHEEVRLTLPLVLVDIVARSVGRTRIDTGHGCCDLDLVDLLADLRKAGPMALVEITGRDGLLKIWLE
jgi:starvation-inducible outer membrane lipoprotein